MSKLIFLNLPVADLPAAKSFYEAIGAVANPTFTDDTAACMVLSDVIHVMLLTHEKFAQFTPKRIADAHTTSEVLLCLALDSRAAVDEITEKALAAGAREPNEPDEYGFMYGRSFEDPDGHLWGPLWMDVEAATAALAKPEPVQA
jgi:predicted lactoylglutathione lyase